MTDKEKKNKIAGILLDFYDEHHSNEINRPMIPSIYAGKILDSLQEEPISIWHDASEKPERENLLIETNDGRIIHRQSINNYGMVKRWAYTSALLNLDNSCNLGNNSQEEPVSGLDNGDMPVERWKQAVKAASNQRNYRSSKGLTETRDDYFVDGVQWADENPKDEPVSEDLGYYINELSKQFPEVSFAKLSRIAVMVAKWQEKQDQKTIELAEDHAMLAGMEKMKEEMMEKAADMVVGYWMPNGLMLTVDETENYYNIDEGDRVKVIIIKED